MATQSLCHGPRLTWIIGSGPVLPVTVPGWPETVTRRGDTGLQVGRRHGPQDGSDRRTAGRGVRAGELASAGRVERLEQADPSLAPSLQRRVSPAGPGSAGLSPL